MARAIPIGEPVNEVERDAIAFLRDGLPADYLVFHNIEIGEPGRAPYEFDQIVVGEHAVYAVEVKGYFGRVTGNKRDWFVDGHHRRSPLPLAFQKARVLAGQLQQAKPSMGAVWVEAVVFLANPEVVPDFPAEVAEHVHTRDTIVQALTDPARLHLPHWPIQDATRYRDRLERFLLGGRPASGLTHVGPYRLLGQIGQTELFTDHEAVNEALVGLDAPSAPLVRLRLYRVDPYAPPEERERRRRRAIWEASVLKALGPQPGLVNAGDPFFPALDDVVVALPFEQVGGVSLRSWLEQHGTLAPDELLTRFGPAIQALALAHSRGVVHRRITPEAFLCTEEEPFRLADFAFSARLDGAQPMDAAILHPRYSAPEVLAGGTGSAAADCYSLATVLLEALDGAPVGQDAPSPPTGPPAGQEARLREALQRCRDPLPEHRPADGYGFLELLVSPAAEHPIQMLAGEVLLCDGAELDGRYRIERRLGPPRTRTIYAARHQTSDMRRALRVFEADEATLAHLRQAFERCYELRHPCLLRVDELERLSEPDVRGPAGHALYYMALEFAPGPALGQAIADAPLGLARAVAVSLQLLELLDYLAEAGLHHGGLGADTIYLAAGDQVRAIPPLTLLPREILSPPLLAYLDPAVEASLAEDLSALGILCWEMATGQHPFPGRVRAPDGPLRVAPPADDLPDSIGLARLATLVTGLLEPDPAHPHPDTPRAFAAALADITTE